MVDWTNTKRKHGTTSGYALHRQLGENACFDCKQAKSQSVLKSKTRKKFNRQYAMARAQSFAKTELVRRHKREYDKLYAKYKVELGV